MKEKYLFAGLFVLLYAACFLVGLEGSVPEGKYNGCVPHTEVWPVMGGTLTIYDDARGHRTEVFIPAPDRPGRQLNDARQVATGG